MGLSGWWSWLSELVEKYKLQLEITKDPEQKKILENIIADLESKENKD
jgi:hypothetical protein